MRTNKTQLHREVRLNPSVPSKNPEWVKMTKWASNRDQKLDSRRVQDKRSPWIRRIMGQTIAMPTQVNNGASIPERSTRWKKVKESLITVTAVNKIPRGLPNLPSWPEIHNNLETLSFFSLTIRAKSRLLIHYLKTSWDCSITIRRSSKKKGRRLSRWSSRTSLPRFTIVTFKSSIS